MCGRYTLTADMSALQERFRFAGGPKDYRPQDNILPSKGVLAVLRRNDANAPAVMRWGLIPHWTTDPDRALINARSETLAQKTSFKQAFRSRRCIIPATGFFEMLRSPGANTPMLISMNTGEPFGMAAIWQPWQDPQAAPSPHAPSSPRRPVTRSAGFTTGCLLYCCLSTRKHSGNARRNPLT